MVRAGPIMVRPARLSSYRKTARMFPRIQPPGASVHLTVSADYDRCHSLLLDDLFIFWIAAQVPNHSEAEDNGPGLPWADLGGRRPSRLVATASAASIGLAFAPKSRPSPSRDQRGRLAH